MSTKIIAFCGVKGSGKSTAASLLEAELRAQRLAVESWAIAGKLKDVCSEVFGIAISDMEDPVLKEAPFLVPSTLSATELNYIYEAFGIHDASYNEFIRKHVGKTLYSPREILQYIGTECLRSISGDIHVATMLQNIHEQTTGDPLIIVTDLRFENEYSLMETCLEKNFFPVYVSNRNAEAAQSTHPSEVEYLQFKDRCFLLDNNGTLGELTANIIDLAARV